MLLPHQPSLQFDTENQRYTATPRRSRKRLGEVEPNIIVRIGLQSCNLKGTCKEIWDYGQWNISRRASECDSSEVGDCRFANCCARSNYNCLACVIPECQSWYELVVLRLEEDCRFFLNCHPWKGMVCPDGPADDVKNRPMRSRSTKWESVMKGSQVSNRSNCDPY